MNKKESYYKLLSMIAHNIKGPVKYMQYITEYTLTNWQKLEPKDLVECASIINESARNITEHLEGMMNWARLQDESIHVEKEEFALTQILNQELKVQKAFLKIKKASFQNNIASGFTLNTDKNILKVGLHNLISNAIKFSKKNGVIEFDAKKENGKVTITIKDDGIGMSKEELEMLRNKKSFTKLGTINEEGSGFGLGVTRELFKLLDAECEFDSAPNVGTTVRIIIPQ